MVLRKPFINYGIIFAVALMMVEFFYPALPMLIKRFDITTQEAQWLVTIFLGAAMIAECLMPIILIRISASTMHYCVWGIGIGASMATLLVDQYGLLVWLRLLMGLSAGGLIILMRFQIEKAEKTSVKGFHYAVGAVLGCHVIMSIIAPVMAASLMHHYGWQAIQYIFIMGFIVILPIFIQWSKKLDLTQWGWSSYVSGVHYLVHHPASLKQIILAGFIGSVPMCETIFSAFFLVNHFGLSVLQLGIYFSFIKGCDACVRLLMPYVLTDQNSFSLINLGFGIFVLGILCLLSQGFYDAFILYVLGCLCIQMSCNGFLVMASIDVFADISKYAPMTANAWFGTLQFGSCFLASAILSLFLVYGFTGFVVFMLLNLGLIIVLLRPRYQTSRQFIELREM